MRRSRLCGYDWLMSGLPLQKLNEVDMMLVQAVMMPYGQVGKYSDTDPVSTTDSFIALLIALGHFKLTYN